MISHPRSDSHRIRAVQGLVLVSLLVAVWWLWPRANSSEVVRAAAAGSMACSPLDPRFGDGLGIEGWCRHGAVSDIVVDQNPDIVFGLGDYQYEEPRTQDYDEVFHPTWGRLRDITRPALGNQEYKVHRANTFRTYFGAQTGPERGWHSFNQGRWRVIVLNSNCAYVDGCELDSPQGQWLQAELARNNSSCTVAYFHHSRWSTGLSGSDDRTDAFWQLLADHGVDLVLGGHEHHYERFVPLDAQGRPDPEGTTSFVVGTGGQAVYGPEDTVGGGDLAAGRRADNEISALRIDDHHGALMLTLSPESFSWQFIGFPAEGDPDPIILDEGERPCTSR